MGNSESKYQLFSDQFGINTQGIHLLRNRFNYESISFNEVYSSSIKRGKEFKNWKTMMFVGVLFFSFAIFHIFNLWIFFNSNVGGTFYIESFLIPFFPIVIGSTLIYLSFRNSIGLEINTVKKRYWLSLRKIEKEDQLNEFKKYIRTKIPELTIEI